MKRCKRFWVGIMAVIGVMGLTAVGYGSTSVSTYFPTASATGVCVDTPLQLTFSSTPTLGSSGNVIIKDSSGTTVDTIAISDVYALYNTTIANFTTSSGSTFSVANQSYSSLPTCANVIGNITNSERARVVNYYPIIISSNTVYIYPHNNVLSYGTQYTVTISSGAFTVGGSATSAISWSFTTKSSATTSTTINVAADGTGDFCTVQGAIDNIKYGNTSTYTIKIAAGTYNELLYLRNKNYINFIGAGKTATIIAYDNYDTFNTGVGAGTSKSILTDSSTTKVSSGGRAVLLMESCKEIHFAYLTIKNTHTKSSNVANQAECIYNNTSSSSSYCMTAYKCNFISYQDTLCLKGYSWFYSCYIAGDVDFIWGSINAALFEDCEIRSRKSSYNEGGYIVQARCSSSSDMGIVFLGCELTADSSATSGKYYLGRTGGSSYYDNVSYLNCTIGSHIASVGWYSSTTTTASSTQGWREYNNTDSDGATFWSTSSYRYKLSSTQYANVYGSGARATILGFTPSITY